MKDEISTAEVIRMLEERLLQPSVRHSAKDVSDLLADDFVEFGSSGNVFTKTQVIESLQRGESARWTLSDFEARTLAPGVVLASYYVVKREPSGRESYSLRSSVWKLTDDKWQMTFHQGTPASRKASAHD